MKILVALKQVPDTETKIKVAADGKSLDPADVKWITSPYDEYALEEAIRIKEAKGAEVVAVSVGDDKAKDILRNALALGADRAILLKSADAADPLAVAKALAACAKELGAEVCFLGHKGYGADNGAVGAMLAGLLGVAQVNLVTKLELAEATFRAEREGDGGTEVVEGALPAVFTAQRGLNEPRYANLKGIMAAKKKPIDEVEAGAQAPATAVSSLSLPAARPEGRRLEGEPAAQAQALVALLRDEAKVI